MKQQLLRIIAHSICIVVLSVLFCKIIPYDPSNLPNLGSPLEMDVTDFYNSVANKQFIPKCDSNVVIVDIGAASRYELAEAIDAISYCEPRVIGLDVIFDSQHDHDEDEFLLQTIKSVPNIVVASSLSDAKRSFFDENIPLTNKGFAELGDESEIVRRLYVNQISGTDTLRSFVSQMVQLAKVGVKEPINGDYIHYPALDYYVININQIEQEHKILKDKFVLIGTLANNEDVFYTPIDLRMNGVRVHAHILSTFLSERRIEDFSKISQWAIALVVVFGLIFLRMYFAFGGNSLGDVIMRITHLFAVWLFVYIGYILFVQFHLYCDLPIALISCISLFVADIWQAIIIGFRRFGKFFCSKRKNDTNG